MSDEALRREIGRLRDEIDRVDDFATGVFQALHDVLAYQLPKQPGIANKLAPLWREVSERYDVVQGSTGQMDNLDETADRLEARKMLYRTFATAGLWSRPGQCACRWRACLRGRWRWG